MGDWDHVKERANWITPDARGIANGRMSIPKTQRRGTTGRSGIRAAACAVFFSILDGAVSNSAAAGQCDEYEQDSALRATLGTLYIWAMKSSGRWKCFAQSLILMCSLGALLVGVVVVPIWKRQGPTTIEHKYDLKSGDTVIVESKWGPVVGLLASGRNWRSSRLLIHWKQSGRSETVSKQFQGYELNPTHLSLVTNRDFLVMVISSDIKWRQRSQVGQWNSFNLSTNSQPLWSFIKNYFEAQRPFACKNWKDDDGHDYLFINANPALINLRDDWFLPCTAVKIDFEHHRLIASCADNKSFPKLVFVEDGQFGRWKFDERASVEENAPTGRTP